MKAKIFQLLKTKYASLGLGDEILQAHAESLAAMGFVTDDNVDSIVEGQKAFLENLQKLNDKRATEAARTAKENAKKEFEEEAKKKAEEAKAAEEEAKKKAEEAKKKADEEAAAKAAKEEEERKKLEEMKKNQEIPQYVKDMQEEYLKKLQEERSKAEEDRAQFKQLLESMQTANKEQTTKLTEQLTALTDQNKQQLETINSMKAESEKLKAESAKKARQDGIIAKAKELGIPQSRIDEGFAITDDMDEDAILNHLNVVATNIKAMGLPKNTPFSRAGESKEVSKEEAKAVAALMVH